MPSVRAAFAVCFLLAGCAAEPGLDDDHDHADVDELAALFGEAAEQVADPGKVDDPSCNGVLVPDRSGFGRRVALTFDDGPNAATTPAVLEVLRRREVPATFFINGNRVVDEATEALARDIAADPRFLLANHTWSHPRSPFLDQMSDARMAAQIDDTTAVIEQAGAAPRFFRFPFGRATCKTANAVRERGYVVTGWHVDSADWCYAGGGGRCSWDGVPAEYRDGDMLGYVLSQVRRSGGGVVLFHDIHRFTADQLEGIIDALEADGYTFTSIDDADTFPRLNGQPVGPERFVGDACEADTDCRFDAGAFCHPAGFCTTSCTGYCPDRWGRAGTFCVEDDASPTGGACVSKATEDNAFCAEVPGTSERERSRFVAEPGVPDATAIVCAP